MIFEKNISMLLKRTLNDYYFSEGKVTHFKLKMKLLMQVISSFRLKMVNVKYLNVLIKIPYLKY